MAGNRGQGGVRGSHWVGNVFRESAPCGPVFQAQAAVPRGLCGWTRGLGCPELVLQAGRLFAFQGEGFGEFNLPVEFVATGKLSWAVSSRSVLGSCLVSSLIARSPMAWKILWQSPRNVSVGWWQCGAGGGVWDHLGASSDAQRVRAGAGGRRLGRANRRNHPPLSRCLLELGMWRVGSVYRFGGKTHSVHPWNGLWACALRLPGCCHPCRTQSLSACGVTLAGGLRQPPSALPHVPRHLRTVTRSRLLGGRCFLP